MRFLKIYLIFVISFCSICCFSQSIDSVWVEKKSSNLSSSYIGILIYAGARLGVELPVNTIYISKIRKSGRIKDFAKDRFVTANLSWYHHPAFHDNVYLSAGWTMRRTKSSGFLTEFSPEIGLSTTFLGGTTYRVDNNENVSIKKCAGYYYALVSVGGGIGYDFSKTKRKPFSVFSKFNVLMMFPYNSTIYLRPLLEIGLIYKPVNFLSLKVKSKSRKK
ncbi:MAG: hypothetical protein GZ094_11700 [Mariniphaga sp.]|nr:hypothetical protein [Mariniphaga sp.]